MSADDPFEGTDSSPAVSWKDVPVGTVKTLEVTGLAQKVQQRVFGTDGELAFWPGKNGEPGNPKWAAVVPVTEAGEPRSLWLPIPSQPFVAFKDAQAAIADGYRVSSGDKVYLKLTERKPSGKGNPQNVVSVKIERGAAAVTDPFASVGSGTDDEPPF